MTRSLNSAAFSNSNFLNSDPYVSLDLRKIETAVCDFFIICHGTSNTHIASIAENVRKEISKQMKEKPWHTEGEANKEWVLIDYFNVVVHIFNKENIAL